MAHKLHPGYLVILLLTGCASITTVKLKSTDTIRNSTITENSEIIFQERQKATIRNPNMEIALTYRTPRKNSFSADTLKTENRKLALAWDFGCAVRWLPVWATRLTSKAGSCLAGT